MNLEIFNDIVSLGDFINNSLLFTAVKPIIVCCFGKFTYDKFKINRKNIIKYGFKIDLPPEIKEVNYDINNLRNDDLFMKDEVLDFEKNLKNNFSLSNLKLFYNNLETLRIYNKFHLNTGSTFGVYSFMGNYIMIYNEKGIINTLNHELSHSASSYYNEEQMKVYSGFSQFEIKKIKSKNKKIGVGFNEFYTNEFSKRYFKNDRESFDYEAITSTIVELTEMIVGKTEMENYYLNGNLYGFIEDLMQYTDSNKYLVKKFLINTDYLYDLYCSEKQDLFTIRKIKKKIKEIYSFLSLCYLKKIYQLSGNAINDDILDFDNSEFFSKIGNNITLDNKEYLLYKNDEKLKMIKHILKKGNFKEKIDSNRVVK